MKTLAHATAITVCFVFGCSRNETARQSTSRPADAKSQSSAVLTGPEDVADGHPSSDNKSTEEELAVHDLGSIDIQEFYVQPLNTRKSLILEIPTDSLKIELMDIPGDEGPVVDFEPPALPPVGPIPTALAWLAKQQLDDGGWQFGGKGAGGMLVEGRNAATALALLPFLRAHQTHKEGRYKETVRAGLLFLIARAKPEGAAASFAEAGGTMYSHGLATLVLCEAYAATQDKRLLAPAQAGIYFSAFAQDPIGGGWRYEAKKPGDTSVTTWQVLALKSGHMAYLKIPPGTIEGVIKFLNSVASDDGAAYGYLDKKGQPTTTAMGLLCRVLSGWEHDKPAVQRGIKALLKTRVAKGDGAIDYPLYHNYMMTELLHQVGGEWRDAWNKSVRGWLMAEQAKDGPHTGSWHVRNARGTGIGGRLYCTSFATLTLLATLRDPPRHSVPDDDFPL